MVIPAIGFYDVVLTVHILAVVLAFGVTFAYPLLDSHVRREHPANLAVLHRFQVVLSRRLISPAMVVVLVAGLYLALDRDLLGEPWVVASLAILFVLFGLAGGVFTPTEKRCAELAQRDAGAGGGPSADYTAQARKLMIFGSLWYVLVIVAIFLMTAKPG